MKRKRYHQFVFEKPERVKRKIHSRLLSKKKRHRLERERERERERMCVYGLGDRLGVEAGKSESVLAIVLDEL